MYARINHVIAQSEMQLTMWIETFKSIGAKVVSDVGAVQLTITKTAPNKATLISVFPNKTVFWGPSLKKDGGQVWQKIFCGNL